MSYTHFTPEERKYLQKLLSEGLSMRKIVDVLERSPSTISREIKRNKTKNKPFNIGLSSVIIAVLLVFGILIFALSTLLIAAIHNKLIKRIK